jgi:hypothetical protein
LYFNLEKNKIVGLKCTDTVAHLKLLLFSQFDIPPNEQALYYNNTLLDKNDKILQEYKILSESTLTLIRVEPKELCDFDGNIIQYKMNAFSSASWNFLLIVLFFYLFFRTNEETN